LRLSVRAACRSGEVEVERVGAGLQLTQIKAAVDPVPHDENRQTGIMVL